MGVDTTTLTVNGVRRVFSMGEAFGQVPYSETLLETLRDRLGLTAAKKACDGGGAGARGRAALREERLQGAGGQNAGRALGAAAGLT